MALRSDAIFGALVAVQAIHSVEECVGRLWESYPPARFVAGLVSSSHAQGFVVLYLAVVAFGSWCYFWPVRRRWPSAQALLWFWVVVETINGIAHPAWALWLGGYSPGVLTAPLLLVLAICLARQLLNRRTRSP